MTIDDKDHTGLPRHKITLPFHLNRKKTLMTRMSSLSIQLFRAKTDFLGARLVGLFLLIFISVGRVEISFVEPDILLYHNTIGNPAD